MTSVSDPNAAVTLTVGPEQAGQRLDKALALLAGEISRARLQQVIKEGGVSLNGAVFSDGSRKVDRPAWLTSRPGSARSRVRMVRATIRRSVS